MNQRPRLGVGNLQELVRIIDHLTTVAKEQTLMVDALLTVAGIEDIHIPCITRYSKAHCDTQKDCRCCQRAAALTKARGGV